LQSIDILPTSSQHEDSSDILYILYFPLSKR